MGYLGTKPNVATSLPDSIVTSDKINDGAVGTNDLANNAVTLAKVDPSAHYYGFKNRIINGDFRIWQRGTSTSGITSGGVFVADRFHTSYGGGSPAGSVTYSRSTDAPTGFKYSARFEQVSATTSPNEYVIRQFVEMQNVVDLIGQTLVLSFRYKSNRTGNHTVRFSHNGIVGASSYDTNFTVNQANTWEYKTVLISALVNATAPGSAADNDWGIHIDVGFKNGVYGLSSINAGDYFLVTGIQLEKGSTATSFDYRPYGTELALCQRYCEAIYATGSGADKDIGTGGGNGNAGNFQAFLEWKTVKRAAPTISLAAASNFYVHVPGAFRVTCATLSANDASEWGVHLQGYSSSNSFGVGQQCFLAVVPNTTVVIASAEL